VRQWEYVSGPILEDSAMNLIGLDCWELVSVVVISVHTGFDELGQKQFEMIPHGYFKRQILS